MFNARNLGKLREKLYSPIQPFNQFDEKYAHLNDQYKRMIEGMVIEYKIELQTIVNRQEYEQAARMRDKYKKMVGASIDRFLEEMEIYDNEIIKYSKDKSDGAEI